MFCEMPSRANFLFDVHFSFFSDTVVAILRAHDVAEVSSLCRVEKTVVTGHRVSVVAKIRTAKANRFTFLLWNERELYFQFLQSFLFFKYPVQKGLCSPLASGFVNIYISGLVLRFASGDFGTCKIILTETRLGG